MVNYMNEIYLERMKEYLGSLYNDYLESLKKEPVRSIRLNNIDIDTFLKNTNMPLEKIP